MLGNCIIPLIFLYILIGMCRIFICKFSDKNVNFHYRDEDIRNTLDFEG